MIKVEKEVSNDYIIKGFKHFTQLATEYFQGHPDCNAARKRMRDTIDANLQLKAELTAASYTEHTTLLSPKMQQIIWAHWGPPIISLSENPRKRIGQQTSLNAQKAKIELYIFKYIIY